MVIGRLLRGVRRPPAVPPGRRVYAIGDVHGRLDLLDRLLADIAADSAARPPAEVEVILLGDLIDRGPASRGVVARAMRPDLGFATLHAIMGNHEAALLDSLGGDLRALDSFLHYGGRETLMSWGVAADTLAGGGATIVDAARGAVSEGEKGWFAALPLSRTVGDYHFVHAGVRPGVRLDAQRGEDLLWIREEFLRSEADHGAVIVHGHTIFEDVQRRHNRVGIDTGAYRTGRLTALALEGEAQWLLQT